MTVADARKALTEGRRQRDRARQQFREAYGEVLDQAQVSGVYAWKHIVHISMAAIHVAAEARGMIDASVY